MARATLESCEQLLREAGAESLVAESVVAQLSGAGLSPSRIRAWLASPARSYSVTTGVLVDDPHDPVLWKQPPIHAVEDGHVEAVLAAVDDFVRATDPERFISTTFICDMPQVRKLTHGDERRTQQVARIAELLLTQLRKETAVYEVIRMRPTPGEFVRLADCMTDDRLKAVLHGLETGTIDPVALRTTGSPMTADW